MKNCSNNKLPISAVMVIYNEERLIEQSLRSFCDIVDEIIIVHDGKCADRSLEIVRGYTDNIFELEHVGEAEQHRPFTYQKAKNDWILQIDADEFLSKELRGAMASLISDDFDIFDVSWSTQHKNKHYFWYYKRMLFRKSKVFFIGVSHESVTPINNNVRLKKIDHVLYHEPLYNNATLKSFQKKWKSWAKIQACQFLEDYTNIPKWNCALNDWKYHQKIRIDHPIIFGMIAGSVYHFIKSLPLFLKHRKLVLLKLTLLAIAYHFTVYYYVLKLKSNGKKYL